MSAVFGGRPLPRPHAGDWVRDKKSGRVGFVRHTAWRSSYYDKTTTISRVYVVESVQGNCFDAEGDDLTIISDLEAMSC